MIWPPFKKSWFAAFAVMLAAVAFLSPSAFKSLKTWRTHKLIHQSEMEYAAGNLSEGFRKAQAAIQLQPELIEALRLMARILSAGNSPQASEIWQALLNHPKVSSSDKVEFILWCSKISRFDAGKAVLDTLLTEPTVSSATLSAAAHLYRSAGAPDRAIQFALESLRTNPDDETTLLLLCGLLTDSKERQQRLRALELLKSLSKKNDQIGLEAIKLTARHPESTSEMMREAVRLLAANPTATADKEILIAELNSRIYPEQLPSIASKLTTSANNGQVSEVETMRWLNKHRLFSQSCSLAEKSSALTNSEACLVYLDAMAGQGKWHEIRTLLEKKSVAIEPALRALFQSRCARELKEDRAERIYWDQALSLAAKKPELLWYFANYSQKLGNSSRAKEALERIAKSSDNPRPAYSMLVSIIEAESNTLKLRQLLSEIALRFPSDPEPRNDLAYLSLLLNQEVQASVKAAEQLVAQEPRQLSYRTTLALGYLRMSANSKAAMVYSGMTTDWGTALPGWQAVYAAVMESIGRRTEAVQIARQIERDRLKPEERLLIQNLL